MIATRAAIVWLLHVLATTLPQQITWTGRWLLEVKRQLAAQCEYCGRCDRRCVNDPC